MIRNVLIGSLCCLLACTAWADSQPVCVNWSASIFTPTLNATGKASADYGLYWLRYDSNTGGEDSRRAYTPSDYLPYFSDGTPNQNPDPSQDGGAARAYYNSVTLKGFYDPSKPTIIFFHGWQPGMTTAERRVDLCYTYPLDNNNDQFSPLYNTLKYWQGWNVAVFYWNQFADEANVEDAEAKLYSSTLRQAMRWGYLQPGNPTIQYCTSGQSNCLMPLNTEGKVPSVSELAYQAIVNAIPAITSGQEFRLAGQSLGGQLAILVSDQLIKNNPTTLMPTQLVLLDPYFTIGTLDNAFGGETVGDYADSIVQDILNHHIPISEYRTSLLSHFPTGDWNIWLMAHTAYTRLYPLYLSALTGSDLSSQQHRSSIYLYFESYKAPSFWDLSTPYTWQHSYVNAQSTNAEILQMMGNERYQQAGLGSFGENHFEDTKLDVFSILPPTQVMAQAMASI